MDSIWTETVSLPHFPVLEGDVKTEVLIIGGGIAGILCAYFLEEKGVDYLLVEGRTLCSGNTGNTTAKITSQHGLIYDKLLRSAGMEKARMYLEANQNAVRKYFELCAEIDCEFEEKTACVYSMDDREKLEKEAEALCKLGFSAELTETKELPFETAGAICFEHQAQFHPLKFLARIAEKRNKQSMNPGRRRDTPGRHRIVCRWMGSHISGPIPGECRDALWQRVLTNGE